MMRLLPGPFPWRRGPTLPLLATALVLSGCSDDPTEPTGSAPDAGWERIDPIVGEGPVLRAIAAEGSAAFTVGDESMTMELEPGGDWRLLTWGGSDSYRTAGFLGSHRIAAGSFLRFFDETDRAGGGEMAWNAMATTDDGALVVGNGGEIIWVRPDRSVEVVTGPTSNHLVDVVHDQGEFVMTDGGGRIWTTPDRVRWTQIADLRTTVRAIARRDDVMVFVSGQGAIGRTDGAGWTEVWSDPVRRAAQVRAFSDGFVAVGTGGLLLLSPDGLTWEVRSLDTTVTLRGIGIGDDLWVVGDDGTTFRSRGGRQWRRVFTARPVNFQTIARPRDDWIAVCSGSRHPILLSRSARDWYPPREVHDQTPLSDLGWNESRLVAVGGTILHAVDPNVWQVADVPDDVGTLWTVAWTGTEFITGGHRGRLLASPDGDVWTEIPVDPGGSVVDLVPWSGEVLGFTNEGAVFALSPDHDLRPVAETGLAFSAVIADDDDLFATAGRDIWHSWDGESWNHLVGPVEAHLNGLVEVDLDTGRGFLAVGDDGIAYISAGGWRWQRVNVETTLDLETGAYTGRWFAAGEFGAMFMSPYDLHGPEVQSPR